MGGRAFHMLMGLGLLALALPARGAEGPSPAEVEFFEKKVRPILHERCWECHGEKKQKSHLRLDSIDAVLKGGEGGLVVVPGEPEKSRLIEAVRWTDPDLQMPPKQKLAAAEVEALVQWVKMGVPWPKEAVAAPARTVAAVFDLQKRKAEHWAWRPIRGQAPPAVKDGAWAAGDIDRFILARLEEKGLRPARPADRRTLIRRVYFDLIGLPPSPKEVEAFVTDPSPDGFEKVVDRLLASEHFGEKWGRHWLDLVRYGETRGHEFDPLIPNAWQYRDYVVRALNADVPYDQFVMEHIAGDLIEKPRVNTKLGWNESILGTGFWFLGEEVHSPVDIRQDETDRLDNRLDTMAKAFLGLTVACARCHDHKFDAIAQNDYYALMGFLQSGTYRQARFGTMEREKEIAEKLEALKREGRGKLMAAVGEALRPTVERLDDYLMGAGEVVGGREADQVARERDLDAKLLAGWVQALRGAGKDRADPFYAFAREVAGKPAEVQKGSSDAALVQQVIVDYGAAGEWYADGFTFGVGPVRLGEPLLGADAERPLLGIADRSAARRDHWFDVLKSASTEKEYGTLGGWDRAGRTLCTPKVTLRSGKVWYLVRGAGRAYAAVDSHLVIAGPLHARLLMEWKGEPNRWKWVAHGLGEYKGERVHVEFSPLATDGELAVAMVVESEQAPAPADETNALLAVSLASAATSAEMARGYRSAFESALHAMGREFPGDAAQAGAAAELVDWAVRHLDLFASSEGEARRELAKVAGALIEKRAGLRRQIVAESPTAPAMLDGNGVDECVLKRGSYKTPGDVVPRRFLEALGGADQGSYGPGSGRLKLARQMLAEDNPFVARVMVNRVWHHLFGVGIVATVDNFGVLGQRPSHPELLDYLAEHVRRDGWSVKRLIRQVVLSKTYQMSGEIDPKAAEVDPQDLLLHHMPVRRLTAEAIRDSMLAVSGRLDRQVGGAPADVYLTPFMDGRGKPGGGPLDGDGRRSIYTRVRRNFLPPMMLAYDMPIPFQCVGRRNVSNVPAQALILMNDPLVAQQAKLWGRRVLAGEARTTEQRIGQMYASAFARPPTEREVVEAKAFLSEAAEIYGLTGEKSLNDERVWADFAHVLFNVKEFVFVR